MLCLVCLRDSQIKQPGDGKRVALSRATEKQSDTVHRSVKLKVLCKATIKRIFGIPATLFIDW